MRDSSRLLVVDFYCFCLLSSNVRIVLRQLLFSEGRNSTAALEVIRISLWSAAPSGCRILWSSFLPCGHSCFLLRRRVATSHLALVKRAEMRTVGCTKWNGNGNKVGTERLDLEPKPDEKITQPFGYVVSVGVKWIRVISCSRSCQDNSVG